MHANDRSFRVHNMLICHLPKQLLSRGKKLPFNLIGPGMVKLPNESYDLYALTIIDPVSNFFNAIPLRNKTASHVGLQFENLWLSRYSRPLRCIHDCGTKFMGSDFQWAILHFGIKDVPTSMRNPQSNAICKRLHQSVGNALHVYLSQDIPFNVGNIAELIDSALATTLHAVRSVQLGHVPKHPAANRFCHFAT
jgi:hypothetical protein